MLKRMKHHLDAAGQALVEFALAATLIFFLLSAAVDLGFVFFSLQGLNNAAQEGARYGARWLFTEANGSETERSLQDWEIRNRVRFESGNGGGVNGVNLHDLDNDGVIDHDGDGDGVPDRLARGDSHAMLETYIQVELLGDTDLQPETDLTPDPDCLNQSGVVRYPCYVRVAVQYDYDMFFGALPGIGGDIELTQAHTERIIDPFDQEGNIGGPGGGGSFTEQTLTPTNTPTNTATPTETNTPTPTLSPTITPIPEGEVVVLFKTPNDSESPWVVDDPAFEDTRFEAIAFDTRDPTYNISESNDANNGRGINRVEFRLLSSVDGRVLFSRNDGKQAYCIFRGNGPCRVVTQNYNAAEVFEDGFGQYRLQARARAASDNQLTDWIEVPIWYGTGPTPTPTLDLTSTPTNTPTATNTPTPTPTPSLNIFLDITLPGQDGQVISTREDTRFEAIAYDRADPSYDPAATDAQNNGRGIQDVFFEILAPPDASISRPYIRTDTDDRYCVFGGGCNQVNSSQAGNIFTVPGEYTLRARARATDGRISDWAERTFTVQPFDATIFAAYKDGSTWTQLPVSEPLLNIDTREASDFRIVAYDQNHPDYNSGQSWTQNDGAGVSLVEYEIYAPSGFLWFASNDTSSKAYCVFGGSNEACNPMSAFDFDNLQEGTWTIRMRASNGFAWSPWVTNSYTVAPTSLFVAFANPPSPGQPFLQRDETDFRVIAYDPQEVIAQGDTPPATDAPIAEHIPFDGVGIRDVEMNVFLGAARFTILEHDKRGSEQNFSSGNFITAPDANTDSTPLYCVFGGDAACNAMHDLEFGTYLGSSGTYTVQARARGTSSDRYSNFVTQTFTLPQEWSCEDQVLTNGDWAYARIGSANTARAVGNGTTGLYMCAPGGGDIGGTSDGMNYYYQEVEPNFKRITARLNEFYPEDAGFEDWMKTGVMVRDSLNGNAANAFVFMSSQNGTRAQWRPKNGNGTSSSGAGGAPSDAPIWLRVERVSGNTFSMQWSPDGSAWTEIKQQQIESIDVDGGDTFYVGIGSTAQRAGIYGRAIYDNVTIDYE